MKTTAKLAVLAALACAVRGEAASDVCIAVEPSEYAALTGKVETIWRAMNATREGRARLHGSCTTRVDANAGEKVETYADGYVHAEKMRKKSPGAMRRFAAPKDAAPKPRQLGARQAEMQRRVDAWSQKAPREVVIEHDAATGKDTER